MMNFNPDQGTDKVSIDEVVDEIEETTVWQYSVAAEHKGVRVDVLVTQLNPSLTRSFVQKLIEQGALTINGTVARANYKLKEGDQVVFAILKPEPLDVVAENIPLDIVYEDADVVVINKPQGMVVHPAAGNYSGTLVNALLYHCKDLSGINGVMRPGIVHRIDKDTSGLLMVAKNDLAHLSLAQQIKDKTVTRKYLALVHDNVREPGGTVDAPIGRDPKDRQRMAVIKKNSKSAITHYGVLQRYGQYTLVECQLETGRTHQIRVHMAFIGHPVVGDPKYGPRKPHLTERGQVLHAAVLGFIHPRSGEYMEFNRPFPEHLQQIIDRLE